MHLAKNRRTHMGNKRTSIAVMAFGFITERFTLLMRQLARIAGGAQEAARTSPTGLVGIGLLTLITYVRFQKFAA